MDKYDIAIVGSGVAGLSAAVNAKIRNKKIIIFGNAQLSYKLVKAPEINNYLGLYGITGEELRNKMKEHLNVMDIEVNYDKITAIYAMGEYFSLMGKEIMYEAKTVIIATGIEYGKTINGEEAFIGKGVSYCATCDAPLYKGKDVIVVAYDKEAIEEAKYLCEMVNKLYYIPLYKGDVQLPNNAEVVTKVPKEIKKEDLKMIISFGNEELKADGIFVLRDSVSPSNLVPGLEVIENHINVKRNMSTNLEGLFAAGDCTGKPYQYMKACGEGQVAALSAVSFLEKINDN